ncbi:glycosyltransferase [Methylobacterium sp. ID0610]|uniref:glycosyltransferase n=1 Tax=Methylobacterium carpenticola TaxID=3344827 RepID=UPI0036B4907D
MFVEYAVRTGRALNGYRRRRPIRTKSQASKDYAAIKNSTGMFDAAWYLTEYPDVKQSGIDPIAHYVEHGSKEGRMPNPLFMTHWYLDRYPEARSSGENPLVHYIRHGVDRGLQPHPLFDTAWYDRQYPDAARGGLHPLAHFLRHAFDGTVDPNPVFGTGAYLTRHPDLGKTGINPLAHYAATDVNFCAKAETARAGQPHRNGREILYIDSYHPRFKADSGSLDALNFLRIFIGLGFKITFIAAAEFFDQNPHRDHIESMGVDCIDYYKFKSVEDLIARQGNSFSIFFLSRIHCGGNYYKAARKAAPEAKIIFNTVDLHHVREEREARLTDDRVSLNRSYWTREREYYLSRMCDATIVVSSVEARIIADNVKGANVRVIPLLRDLTGRGRPFAERDGVGFIGGYRHTPNIDALLYLLTEIWPRVTTINDRLTLYVMGADLPASFRERNDHNVVYVGYVDDMAEAFGTLRVTTAPLRYGAGAKGKLVSSLLHGVPCVATPVAAEGMDLVSGQDVLVADDPAAFAAMICRLHDDPALWERVSRSGYAHASQLHDINRGSDLMRSLLESIRSDWQLAHTEDEGPTIAALGTL